MYHDVEEYIAFRIKAFRLNLKELCNDINKLVERGKYGKLVVSWDRSHYSIELKYDDKCGDITVSMLYRGVTQVYVLVDNSMYRSYRDQPIWLIRILEQLIPPYDKLGELIEDRRQDK